MVGEAVPVVVLMTAAMTAALRAPANVLVTAALRVPVTAPVTAVTTDAMTGVLRALVTVLTTAVPPTCPEIAMAGPHCGQKSVTAAGLFAIASAMTSAAQNAQPSVRATRRAPLK